MDFPVFINKFIIGNRYLRYHPIWWWYRLISHSNFRFDDYYVWGEFWHSLNSGWLDTNYKWEYKNVWGKNAKPETIVLSQENFDNLQKRLAEPPDPKAIERVREIMNRRAPWDD